MFIANEKRIVRIKPNQSAKQNFHWDPDISINHKRIGKNI